MKKKPQRHSYKKLNAFSKKPELKYLDLLSSSHDKSIKSQSKHKSSERVISTYENSNKFKITKNNNNSHRIKTEADEFATTKTPFQKFIQTKRDKQERSSRNKSGDKSKHFFQTKHLNLKKLNLGLDLCNFVLIQIRVTKITPTKNTILLTQERTIVLGKHMNHIVLDSRKLLSRSM